MTVLEKEIKSYQSLKDDLLKHYQGKYALIHEEKLIGVWDTPENAYIAGVERFGNVPFLIQHIVTEDVIETVPLLFAGNK